MEKTTKFDKLGAQFGHILCRKLKSLNFEYN